MVKQFISDIVGALKRVRAERNRQWFEKMALNPDTGISAMINQRAQSMALQGITNWLDKKRIRHCVYCPATESLRAVGHSYLCQGHFDQVNAEAARRVKEEQKVKGAQTVTI